MSHYVSRLSQSWSNLIIKSFSQEPWNKLVTIPCNLINVVYMTPRLQEVISWAIPALVLSECERHSTPQIHSLPSSLMIFTAVPITGRQLYELRTKTIAWIQIMCRSAQLFLSPSLCVSPPLPTPHHHPHIYLGNIIKTLSGQILLWLRKHFDMSLMSRMHFLNLQHVDLAWFCLFDLQPKCFFL